MERHYEPCCTSTELSDFCMKLPKVELHAHLNGSISDLTMRKLVQRFKTQKEHLDTNETSSFDEWTITIEKGSKRTLKECFIMFKIIHTIVCDTEAVEMVAHDVVSDFAADGVIYLELRSTPRHNPATGMTKVGYIDAMIQGIKQGITDSNSSIDVRLLLSVDRSKSVEDALETVRLAEQYSKCSDPLVVGIDLSGNPEVGDVGKLLPALKKAKDLGLKLAIHLAEIPDVDKETSLLLNLRPDRIGHGTYLLPSIGGSLDNFDVVTNNRIPLELCLTSNLKCQTVASYDQHHFGFWIQNSHPLALSTDDKGVFCTTLSEEYEIAAVTFDLSTSDLLRLSKQAVDYIFDDKLKTKLRQRLNKI